MSLAVLRPATKLSRAGPFAAIKQSCIYRCLTQNRSLHMNSYLVTPKELHEALKSNKTSSQQSIIPVCASWFLPNDPESRTGCQTYEAQRIPGARFFDIDKIKDPDSPYPHMLPSATDFAEAVGALGISNEDTVVIYDTKELGIFSGPRVGWTFKAFGHEKVHLLNNFRIWVDEGYPTETGKPEVFQPKTYTTPSGPFGAVDFEYVKAVVSGEKPAQLLDARPKGRFDGIDKEPRPGLPSGHYPGSVSIAFSELLDPRTKTILPPERLKEVLQSKGVVNKGTIVSACGTGVSAAILDTALAEAGFSPDTRFIYDGSWTEWAQRVTPEENLIEKTA